MPKLTADQRDELARIVTRPATEFGFETPLWTCRRLVSVIAERFGVTYHSSHLGRVLHAMGFSPQRPVRVAAEPDPEAVEAFRTQDWPRIKKGRKGKLASS